MRDGRLYLGNFLDRAAMLQLLEVEAANLESVQSKVSSRGFLRIFSSGLFLG
jgi:hypothetical protein